MTPNANPAMLRKVFTIDAVASILFGLDLILFADLAAAWFGGFSADFYMITGFVFVLWGIDMAAVGWINSLRRRFSQAVVYVDAAFGVLAVGLLAAYFQAFTALGVAMMLAMAAAGFGFARYKQKGIGNPAELRMA